MIQSVNVRYEFIKFHYILSSQNKKIRTNTSALKIHVDVFAILKLKKPA